MFLQSIDAVARREARKQATLDWLTGNFRLRPFITPLITKADVIATDKSTAKRPTKRKRALSLTSDC